MLKRLKAGFIAYMFPRGRRRSRIGSYGINVTDYDPNGVEIAISFTFRNDKRYCCSASSCHHGLLFGSDYERLRMCFSRAGVEVGKPMTVRMRVVCEAGALFALEPGNPKTKHESSSAWQRDEVYDESKAS